MEEIASMMFLGVDPGFSGALGLVDESSHLQWVIDTPVMHMDTKLEYDRQEIKRILQSIIPPLRWFIPATKLQGTAQPGEAVLVDHPSQIQFQAKNGLMACVELIHAMPGQGVVSMWRMGQGFELWCMAFTCLGIPWETVTPQRWKSVMLDGMPKDKDASRYRAKHLWSDHAAQFARKKDHGRAEAALIAEYLRRQWVKR